MGKFDGLSGPVTIYTRKTKVLWGVPSADADILATQLNRPDRAVLFAYDQGDTLANGQTAAGIRMGLFLTTASDNRLNATGEQLLVDSVAWAAS